LDVLGGVREIGGLEILYHPHSSSGFAEAGAVGAAREAHERTAEVGRVGLPSVERGEQVDFDCATDVGCDAGGVGPRRASVPSARVARCRGF